MDYSITSFIEIIGTVSFAMSGAFAAMQKKFDLFGVLIIAFVTAVGGGTIRDILIDAPVFWMHDMFSCAVIFISTIIAILVKSIERNFKVTLFLFDSFGLGLFTIVGVQKGMNIPDLSPLICVVLGTITGCFGGVSRDILLRRIPLIFRKEIYATACLVGGITYYCLDYYLQIPQTLNEFITIIIIVGIRTLAVQFKWHMPAISNTNY